MVQLLQIYRVRHKKYPLWNFWQFSQQRLRFREKIYTYLDIISKILHHPNHLLAPLLPNEAHTHTPYHLRPRRHNRQLIPKINKLYDSNFIQRMLYKNLY